MLTGKGTPLNGSFSLACIVTGKGFLGEKMIAEKIISECNTYYDLACACFKHRQHIQRNGYENSIKFIFYDESVIEINTESKFTGYFGFWDHGKFDFGFVKPMFKRNSSSPTY